MADNCITTGLKKLKPLFVDSKRHLVSQGGMRDFQAIMKAADIWEPERWNQSSKIYAIAELCGEEEQ